MCQVPIMFRFPLQRKYNWSNNDQCCTNWRLSEKHKLVKLNGHVTYMRALWSYLRYTLFRSKTCRMLSFSDGEIGSHTWHDVNQLSRNLGAALYICHIGTGRSFHGYSIEIYEFFESSFTIPINLYDIPQWRQIQFPIPWQFPQISLRHSLEIL